MSCADITTKTTQQHILNNYFIQYIHASIKRQHTCMYVPTGVYMKVTRDTLFELVTTESEFYCPHSDVGYCTKIHSPMLYYHAVTIKEWPC